MMASAAVILGMGALLPARAAGPEEWAEFRHLTVATREVVEIALDDTAVLTSGDTTIIRRWDGRRLWVELPDTSTRIYTFQRNLLGPLNVVIDAEEKGKLPSTAPIPGASSSITVTPISALMPIVLMPFEAAATVLSPASSELAASSAVEPRPVSVAPMPRSSFPAAALPAEASRQRALPPISAPPRPLVLSTPPAPGSGAPRTGQGNSYDRDGVTVEAVTPVSPGEPVSIARSVPVPTGSRLAADTSPSYMGAGDFAAPIPPSVIERAVPRGSMIRVDTSPVATALAKPGELALFELATDLMSRGLFGDAVAQYRRFLNDFPKSGLKEIVLINVGEAYRHRAESFEKEALRQRDLRRTGAATEALDAASADFAEAVNAYRDFQRLFPKSPNVPAAQLAIAQSVHGQVRVQFQKGGQPQDSPAVVVEYLRAYVGLRETTASPAARLGIAQYYRDLGDARLAAQMDRPSIREAYNRAIEEYNALAATNPGHPAAPEALIDIARLYDRNLEMRRFSESVRYYEKILALYPTSPFAAEARERSRWIRENYL